MCSEWKYSNYHVDRGYKINAYWLKRNKLHPRKKNHFKSLSGESNVCHIYIITDIHVDETYTDLPQLQHRFIEAIFECRSLKCNPSSQFHVDVLILLCLMFNVHELWLAIRVLFAETCPRDIECTLFSKHSKHYIHCMTDISVWIYLAMLTTGYVHFCQSAANGIKCSSCAKPRLLQSDIQYGPI